MPNLIDFINSDENKNNGKKIDGQKPCSKCELNVDSYIWDEEKLTMEWVCEVGHKTVHRIG